MNIDELYFPIHQYFRTKRMRRFQCDYALTDDSRVLDVGGTLSNWGLISVRPFLTLLNLTIPPRDRRGNEGTKWIIGDGCHLPWRDEAFDIVYSNSVIEHLGTTENQQRFAAEVARVAARYFVQTPNRWFPVEPHYLTPFVHFLPKRWQRRIVKNFTVWGLMAHPTDEQCEANVSEILLLDYRAMRRLFPDAEIHCERFLGFTKALIAKKI